MNTASVEEPALMVEKITGRTRDTPGVNKTNEHVLLVSASEIPTSPLLTW